jgi:hypothetical protein
MIERARRLLFVDAEGVPRAVQFVALDLDDDGECHGVMWRDCCGRSYRRSLEWMLRRRFDSKLRTRDQLFVCQNYSRMLLEQDVSRWWGREVV